MVVKNATKLPGASVVFLTDVSSVETDDTCGMRYWMSKLEGGKGILKESEVIRHLLDAEIHNDLRALSTLPEIDPVTIQGLIDEILGHLTQADKADMAKMELLYRRLGQFAAFALYLEPAIRAEYETLPVDPAIILDGDPLWTVVYPDRILKDRQTGEVSYREYVPMGAGLTQDKWLQGWHYNVRLHLGLAAAQQANLSPIFAQIMGMSQGFRSALDHRLVHPYVWGYRNPITDEWATTTGNRTSSETWVLMPVWAFPGGVVAWVRQCGEATAKSQFQFSPPVYHNADIVKTWTARRIHREREIAALKEISHTNVYMRSVYFAKVTTQCYPATGESCPYLHACWDKPTGAMPLKSGLYVPALPAETEAAIQ